MDRSPSAEEGVLPLDTRDAELLLDLAEAALDARLSRTAPTLPDLHSVPPPLRARRGVFVTLRVAGELAGCIGDVEGIEPLVHAVPRLALASAFEDLRLPPLRRSDVGDLTIEVSLLTPLQRLDVRNRAELIAAVRAGLDGVLIRAGSHRGILLPQVWRALPDPDEFLVALWRKAGLAPESWPADLTAFVFQVRHHARTAGAAPRRRRRSAGRR